MSIYRLFSNLEIGKNSLEGANRDLAVELEGSHIAVKIVPMPDKCPFWNVTPIVDTICTHRNHGKRYRAILSRTNGLRHTLSFLFWATAEGTNEAPSIFSVMKIVIANNRNIVDIKGFRESFGFNDSTYSRAMYKVFIGFKDDIRYFFKENIEALRNIKGIILDTGVDV